MQVVITFFNSTLIQNINDEIFKYKNIVYNETINLEKDWK